MGFGNDIREDDEGVMRSFIERVVLAEVWHARGGRFGGDEEERMENTENEQQSFFGLRRSKYLCEYKAASEKDLFPRNFKDLQSTDARLVD